MAILILIEALDYITRRYAEALPTLFTDVVRQRMQVAFLRESASFLQNGSKERLLALIDRYINHVYSFLQHCEWQLFSNLTRFVIIVGILAYQSPVVLLVNLGYIGFFLWFGFALSVRFAKLADMNSTRAVDFATLRMDTFLNLPFFKRMVLSEFLSVILREKARTSWEALHEVRKFHAFRWFVQLNIFNFMYFATLIAGVIEVKQGTLSLGFLLLIKWSFDELWKILVYLIEYYVSMIEQRADAHLLRCALPAQLESPHLPPGKDILAGWNSLLIRDAQVSFSLDSGARMVSVSVPDFILTPAHWVGVMGPSGAGKTTLLYMVMGAMPFSGEMWVDGNVLTNPRFSRQDILLITPKDPLFKLSIRLNLTLGETFSDEEIKRALQVVGADFVTSLEVVIGSVDCNLSWGQEQRIKLARGILHKSKILLLDEPFTGLDESLKADISLRLKNELRDRAVVLVTHDPEDMKLVDVAYRMEAGELVRLSSLDKLS